MRMAAKCIILAAVAALFFSGYTAARGEDMDKRVRKLENKQLQFEQQLKDAYAIIEELKTLHHEIDDEKTRGVKKIEALKAELERELEEARSRIQELERDNAELKKKLGKPMESTKRRKKAPRVVSAETRRTIQKEMKRTGWPTMHRDLQATRRYPTASKNPVGNMRLRNLKSLSGHMVRTADISGDGSLELVIGSRGMIRIYHRDGSILHKFETGAEHDSPAFILGDISGNGRPEIIVGGYERGSHYSAAAYTRHGHLVVKYRRYAGVRDNNLTPLALVSSTKNTSKRLIAQAGSGYGRGFRGVVVFDAENGQEIGAYETGPAVSFRGSGVSIANTGVEGDFSILRGSFGPANGKSANGTSDKESWLFMQNDDGSLNWSRRLHGSGFVDATARFYDIFGDGFPVIAATATSHGWRKWNGHIGRLMLLDPKKGDVLSGYENNIGFPVEIQSITDLNDNGRPDILLAGRDGSKKKGVLMMMGAEKRLPLLHTFERKDEVVRLGAITDLNGDGFLNVIVRAKSTIYVLDNKLSVIAKTKMNDTVRDLIVSDVTGDGNNEIIAWDRNSQVNIYGAVSKDEYDAARSAEPQVIREKNETPHPIETAETNGRKQGRPTKNPAALAELIEAIGPKLVYADGREASSGMLAEKDCVLLYFSAEWCGPCRTFTPYVVDFYEQYSEKSNLEIVLISSDRSRENMLKYMKNHEMSWPAVPYKTRHESGLANTYGVRGIPRLIALNAKGEIIKDSSCDGRRRMLSELRNMLRE